MKNVNLLLLVLAGIFVFTGCSYNEGVVLTEKPAYLQFLGDASNVEIMIDNTRLDVADYGDKISKNLFKYNPGYHEVTIYKHGEMIMKKIVLLENGKTTQVEIP